MVIEVRNLVKKYKDNIAVNGINLDIQEKEIFGLLGPNGAGKSTTLNTIVGLLQPNEGSIQIFGLDLKRKAREIKKNIGYVPQDFAFFTELSALDNVTYWGRLYGLRGYRLKKAVREALEFTGLWEKRKSTPNKYSGGMKRRLNIACAIVHKPKLILMDEPTAGVDPQSRNNILESIRVLNSQGTTVIYTSHYMEEIEAICNRVAIMDFGKVIAQGTIDELVDSISDEETVNVEFAEEPKDHIESMRKIRGVKKVEQEDNKLILKVDKNNSDFTSLVHSVLDTNLPISGISVEKMNLETVFLRLTGKKLRD